MKKNNSHNRGATLLIAVLMTSVVLSVGMGIYQRTYKSLVFSSYWKQTQIAFAAADAGIECAIYWDSHPPAVGGNARCFGQDISWNPAAIDVPQIIPPIPVSGGCVDIIITRQATFPTTIIQARGHDKCDPANPRRVERALQFQY